MVNEASADSSSAMSVSVVVPVYNESRNIVEKAETLARYCKENQISAELIFVNDGSTDSTNTELTKLENSHSNVVAVNYKPNRGIGFAIRTGMAQATRPLLLTIDADLSYGPDHIPLLLKELIDDPKLDMVVGSAYMAGGSNAHVPAWRLFSAKPAIAY